MMFKIYVPDELTYFYADEYGERYDAPSGDVVEAPYSEDEAVQIVRQLRTDRLYQCAVSYTHLTLPTKRIV